MSNPRRQSGVAPSSALRPPAGAVALGIPAVAFQAVLRLPDNRWLDRIIRGRVWIPVLGALLVLIVGVQVEVLKLGTSVGRSITLAAELQSRSEIDLANVTRLSDPSRIERLAARLGMRMPGPTDIRFLGPSGASVLMALATMQPPNPQLFLSHLQAQLQADAATATATAPVSSAGTSTASTTTAPGTAGISTGVAPGTGAGVPAGAAGTGTSAAAVTSAGAPTSAAGATVPSTVGTGSTSAGSAPAVTGTTGSGTTGSGTTGSGTTGSGTTGSTGSTGAGTG